MFKFIARRILETIPVLFILTAGSFFMIHAAPGGPFDSERRVTPEIQRNLDAYYNLNKPVYQQFLIYMGHLLRHGDMGPSFKYPSRTVNELIGESFPVSIELGLYGMAIALAIGLTAGIIASLRPNSASDYVPMSFAMMGVCLPTYVLGPLLVLFFSLYGGLPFSLSTEIIIGAALAIIPALFPGKWYWRLARAVPGPLIIWFLATEHRWFNPSGWDVGADRVLPALTLGIFYAAYIARLTRGGMLEVLSQDYIRTARAKGASEARVVFKHALRGGLLPVVSFLGPALAGIVSGSFVVEKVFNIPGLGQYFITSALNRDYTMVMGTVIFFAVLIVFFNLLVDIAQAMMNPRVRLD